MKNKFKILLLLASLLVLLGAFCVNASAATSVQATATPKTRNTVELSFKAGVSFMTSMQLYVEYDSDALVYNSVKLKDESATDCFCSVNELEAGKLIVNFFASKYVNNKDFVSVMFDIRDEKSGEYTFDIGYKNVYVAPLKTGENSVLVPETEVLLNDASFTVPVIKDLVLLYGADAMFYLQGEATEPDYSSLRINVKYSTGDFLLVDKSLCEITTDFIGDVPGTYKVNVLYKGFSKSYDCTVGEAPHHIEIRQAPYRVKYQQNTTDELNLEGLEVIPYYGQEPNLKPARNPVLINLLSVTGFDPTAAVGEQTITVNFFDKTAEFKIIIEPEFAKGDVDMDGNITASDARLALRAAVNLEKLSDVQLILANVDKSADGKITAGDARLILRGAVKLEDTTLW